jgi:hypothetical protein
VVGALRWVVVKLRKFGSRFPCVLCGVFGVRGMQGFLKMWNYRFWNYVEMCLICYMYGSRLIVRVVLCLLSFYIHVLLFPLIRGIFVYFLCTRVAPSAIFNEILLLIKKKTHTHKNGEQRQKYVGMLERVLLIRGFMYTSCVLWIARLCTF